MSHLRCLPGTPEGGILGETLRGQCRVRQPVAMEKRVLGHGDQVGKHQFGKQDQEGAEEEMLRMAQEDNVSEGLPVLIATEEHE